MSPLFVYLGDTLFLLLAILLLILCVNVIRGTWDYEQAAAAPKFWPIPFFLLAAFVQLRHWRQHWQQG